MAPHENRSSLPALLLILTLGTLYRAVVLATSGLDLYVDEAQYWFWAQDLAWGYYSKPPVIAALIWATTGLFGDGEFAVKCAALALYPLTTLLVYAIAARLFDARIAFWSAVAFFTLPGVALSSLIISTDVALFVCWAAATYALLRAASEDRWHWWLAVGAASGIGLLAKYTMGIFAVSALLHLLSHREYRRHFTNPKPYAGALLAGLIFAPNLAWNAANGWPTFQHTADISNLDGGPGLHWDELWEFVGGQAGILGLVFFAAFAWLLLRPWWRDPALRTLACFTLPFLAVISLQALLGRANANWAAMAYVTGTVWIVAWLLRGGRHRWLVAGIAFNLLLAALTYHYHALMRAADVPLSGRAKPAECWRALRGDAAAHCPDFFKRVQGWEAAGAAVRQRLEASPGTRLLSDERDLMSEFAYYARPASQGAALWNGHERVDSHYALVARLPLVPMQDYLYVTRRDALPPALATRFVGAEPQPPIVVEAVRDWPLRFSVWRLVAPRQ